MTDTLHLRGVCGHKGCGCADLGIDCCLKCYLDVCRYESGRDAVATQRERDAIAMRNLQVRELRLQGTPTLEIAKVLGVSVRTIHGR